MEDLTEECIRTLETVDRLFTAQQNGTLVQRQPEEEPPSGEVMEWMTGYWKLAGMPNTPTEEDYFNIEAWHQARAMLMRKVFPHDDK